MTLALCVSDVAKDCCKSHREGRNPRAEIRKLAEGRNPNPPFFRFSDFDLLSAFEDSAFGFGPGSSLLQQALSIKDLFYFQ